MPKWPTLVFLNKFRDRPKHRMLNNNYDDNCGIYPINQIGKSYYSPLFGMFMTIFNFVKKKCSCKQMKKLFNIKILTLHCLELIEKSSSKSLHRLRKRSPVLWMCQEVGVNIILSV